MSPIFSFIKPLASSILNSAQAVLNRWVKPEGYSKTLFIMDVGYNSDELEHRIERSGNHFLIKGKKSMAGFVTKSAEVNGTKHREHYGKKES